VGASPCGFESRLRHARKDRKNGKIGKDGTVGGEGAKAARHICLAAFHLFHRTFPTLRYARGRLFPSFPTYIDPPEVLAYPSLRIPLVSPEHTPPAERKQSVARNPKATHDYHILETWETGIVLTGTEVKSLRSGKASIREAYARVRNGEVFLDGMNITPYEQGNRYNHDPVRTRKLLLHRREIEKLIGAVEQRGLTLVPLELYFKNGRAKVALALGKGKKQHDKREAIKRKIQEREVARAVSVRGRR
jgi:SsrA-binding protein